MSYNHTYAQIKDILKSSKKMTKEKMLKIASLAIIETVGSEMPEGTEITGNREIVQTSKTVDESNVIDMKRLAGIK